ncbi:MAG: PaaI family thioesterase [Pikeienuella sp.]
MSRNGFESTTDFNAHVGYRLVDWGAGTSCIELDIEPQHLNSQGIGHGGVLLSLLDSACGACGSTEPPPAPRCISVTISLTANFVHPMRGKTLLARGRMTGGGRGIYFAEGTVHDETGQLIATASGAFKRVKKTA